MDNKQNYLLIVQQKARLVSEKVNNARQLAKQRQELKISLLQEKLQAKQKQAEILKDQINQRNLLRTKAYLNYLQKQTQVSEYNNCLKQGKYQTIQQYKQIRAENNRTQLQLQKQRNLSNYFNHVREVQTKHNHAQLS